MDIRALHVPIQFNPLYSKSSQAENPSTQGKRVQYEKKVFTNWINSYVEQASWSRLTDLQEDLSDGITLLRFVKLISFETPPCIHLKPALYVQCLENTDACLSFLDRLGVDLQGVHAEDVVCGNIKSILALCRAMHISFEGDLAEDHHSLSPMLSWKQKSPSSSLSVSLSSSSFAWPESPWKRADGVDVYQGESPWQHDETETTANQSGTSSLFTVWYKEDMAVFSWIQRLLGLQLRDYSEFDDGVLMCAIVNQLWMGSITQEEVLYSSPLERLEIATEAAEQYLGVPRTQLILRDIIAGQGREALPWYLLELKEASEQMLRDYLSVQEERARTRDDEETVNRMQRQLFRQHPRDQETAAITTTNLPIRIGQAAKTPAIEHPTVKITQGLPERSNRSDLKTGQNQNPRPEILPPTVVHSSQKIVPEGHGASAESLLHREHYPESFHHVPWKSECTPDKLTHIHPPKTRPPTEACNFTEREFEGHRVSDISIIPRENNRESFQSKKPDKIQKDIPMGDSNILKYPQSCIPSRMAEVEIPAEVETSLSSLMKPETRVSTLFEPETPLHKEDNDETLRVTWNSSSSSDAFMSSSNNSRSKQKTATSSSMKLLKEQSDEDAPSVPWNSFPSSASTNLRRHSEAAQSVTNHTRRQEVASFFSPFSMPFLAIGDGRRHSSSTAKIGNTVNNSSSSVLGDDNLSRGKLTSWSDKDVRETQTEARRSQDDVLTQKPNNHGLSATMLARLAARSPGGVADLSSSDSDG